MVLGKLSASGTRLRACDAGLKFQGLQSHPIKSHQKSIGRYANC